MAVAPGCCPPRVSGTGTQLFSSHRNFRSQARDIGRKPVSDFKAPLCTRPFTQWASWRLLVCSCLLGSPGAPCCAQGQRPGCCPVGVPTISRKQIGSQCHPTPQAALLLVSSLTSQSPLSQDHSSGPRCPVPSPQRGPVRAACPALCTPPRRVGTARPSQKCRLSDQSGPHRSQASLCSPPLGD